METVLDEVLTDEEVNKLKNSFEQMFIRMEQVGADCMAVLSGDLSKKELMVIDFVGKVGSCIMKDIAERLNAPVSTLTSMIDKLVTKKQLNRERSDDDRRIVKVMLGDIGKETYKAFEDAKIVMSKAMMSALEKSEQEELCRLFTKITTHAKKV